MRKAEMRKPELKRITTALRQLTPDQRKRVAVELAALDAQPASLSGGTQDCATAGTNWVPKLTK